MKRGDASCNGDSEYRSLRTSRKLSAQKDILKVLLAGKGVTGIPPLDLS
jgi:hypothetical protein